MEIFDWTSRYIKYKDAVKKSILELEEKTETNEIFVKEKSGKEIKYVCFNELDDLDVTKIKDEKIVSLNTKSNIDWLLKNWKEIVKTKVTFIFANPERSANWAINPALHHIITDKSALKTGIYTLFESIPEV